MGVCDCVQNKSAELAEPIFEKLDKESDQLKEGGPELVNENIEKVKKKLDGINKSLGQDVESSEIGEVGGIIYQRIYLKRINELRRKDGQSEIKHFDKDLSIIASQYNYLKFRYNLGDRSDEVIKAEEPKFENESYGWIFYLFNEGEYPLPYKCMDSWTKGGGVNENLEENENTKEYLVVRGDYKTAHLNLTEPNLKKMGFSIYKDGPTQRCQVCISFYPPAPKIQRRNGEDEKRLGYRYAMSKEEYMERLKKQEEEKNQL